MAHQSVLVRGQIPAPPTAVWAVARDFCGHWHPAVATIRAERGPGGVEIRAFTLHGDTTLYREQLIFRSDSDRTLAYLALEGIQGAERYVGRITLTASETGTTITASAEVTAPARRAAQIVQGSRPILEAGIAGLAAAVALARPAPAVAQARPAPTVAQARPAPTVAQARPAPAVAQARPAAAANPTPVDTALETVTLVGTPRLALTVTPAKPGPLVLFVHGIGGARGNWDCQLRCVAPHARAAALDLRGYGGSALGPAQSTVEDHCDDILRAMQALSAEKLILVGLSFGAWIATSFALRHPDKLGGLVLSGGCTGMSEAGPQERELFRLSRQAPLDAGKTPADFAAALVKVLAGPNATDAAKAELRASMSAIPAATYRDALICYTNPPQRFDFARLGMPVLLMTGQHDRLAPPSEIRGVAHRIVDAARRPDVRFEQIADAGHLCNLEHPQAYNRVLIDFVRQVLP